MKSLNFILGLLLATAAQLSAQVSVEVTFDQEQFLPGEALPAIVKIRNRSGQTLNLGRETDWLTFSVESREGFVVVKSGEAPVTGEFKLETSQVATKVVDLAPFFALTKPGRYNVIASVRIKEWDGQLTSPPKGFDIITGAKLWTQEFGVPSSLGANQSPEVRRYTLQQANYLRSQLRLYLRLTDESESRVLKVVSIGPLVGLSQPEPQIDQLSNLHVLYQNGPRTFSYTVINPNGEIITRQTYDFVGARPRLKASKEGGIAVTGGVRRVTSSDIPRKSDDDQVPPPKS